MSTLALAFTLTLFAGLSTGLGSAIALLAKKTNTSFLAFSLGLSAGVMIYISFVEILPDAQKVLILLHGAKNGKIYTLLAFFSGIALIGIIDALIPSEENPHEVRLVEDINSEANQKKLMRTGILTAIAITIHNFPEGLATFIATISDPNLGYSVAFAVAIHNIPEGIAVSVPIYYATKSRKKAFWLSFASGLSEPVGAVLGYFLIQFFFPGHIMGIVSAMVAGIMVFISLDELLPAAHQYGKYHTSILGVIIGMAIMAMSLLMFT